MFKEINESNVLGFICERTLQSNEETMHKGKKFGLIVLLFPPAFCIGLLSFMINMSEPFISEIHAFKFLDIFSKVTNVFIVLLTMYNLLMYLKAMYYVRSNFILASKFFHNMMMILIIIMWLLLLPFGSLVIISYLQNYVHIYFIYIIITFGIIANWYSLFKSIKVGYLTFVKLEFESKLTKNIRYVFKKIWPFMGIAAVISFSTKGQTEEFGDWLTGLLLPFIILLGIPVSYVIFVIFGPIPYNAHIAAKYPEQVRNHLGKSYEEFYGKRYKKSKKVMQQIEEFNKLQNEIEV